MALLEFEDPDEGLATAEGLLLPEKPPKPFSAPFKKGV
jgi:hypothetical protein